MTDISIVIVSWNVRDLLAECIESLATASRNFRTQVIVVDNASEDGTVEMLRARFPHVMVVPAGENLGFARANNLGFAHSDGEFVFLLNPDTQIREETIERLRDVFARSESVGAVGPRLVYPGGAVQPACARRLPPPTWALYSATSVGRVPYLGKRLRKRLEYPYDHNKSQEVEAISGAAMLVRRDILVELGGFGESFLHAGEDLELCFRIRRSGWTIQYVADAVVVHLKGQSEKQDPITTAVATYLSVEQYYDRCFGRRYAAMYRVLVIGVQMPLMLVLGTILDLVRLRGRGAIVRRAQLAVAVWRWRPRGK